MIEPSKLTKILAVVVERGASRGLAMVGFVLVARYYGAEAFGQLGYLFALGAFFAPVATYGLGNVMLRYFGTAQQGAAVRLAVRWRAAMGAGCFLAFPWVYRALAPANPLPAGFVWLFAASFLLTWMLVAEEWMFFSQNHRNLITGGLAGSAANLVVRGAAVICGAPVAWLVVVPGMETLIKSAVHGRRAWQDWRSAAIADVAIGLGAGRAQGDGLDRTFRRDGLNLTLAGLSVLVLTRTDLIMLGQMVGERAVGIYAVAVQCVDLVPMVMVIFVRMLARDFVTVFRRGEAAFVSTAARMLGPGLWVIGCAAVGMWWAGAPLVRLVFGDGYAEAGRAIAVLLVAQVFVFVGLMRGQYLTLVQDTGYGVWSTAAGAAANIVLNAWAIPRYGLLGAAGATCVARILMSAVLPLWVPSQRMFNRAVGRALLSPWPRKADA